jgi:hypothetical protein
MRAHDLAACSRISAGVFPSFAKGAAIAPLAHGHLRLGRTAEAKDRSFERVLWKADHEARPAPKFDAAAPTQPPSPLDSFFVIGAHHWLNADDVTIQLDEVGEILLDN